MSAVLAEVPKLLKLDLGCGKNKREGFVGVDSRQFEGVDVVVNLVERPKEDPSLYEGNLTDAGFFCWPWKDESVEEVQASHVVEHFTAPERIHFVNELYRVLVKGGKATVIVPHWASNRAYGDLTHQWPPVSEMWFYYLSKTWREQNAPHNDFYTCDFDATWGYGMHPAIIARNPEYQQFAMQNYKEACTDTICTLTKK